MKLVPKKAGLQTLFLNNFMVTDRYAGIIYYASASNTSQQKYYDFFAVSANIGNLRSVIFLNKLSLRSYYLIYNIYARMYNKHFNNYLPLFR
jgi:hypothetical protein